MRWKDAAHWPMDDNKKSFADEYISLCRKRRMAMSFDSGIGATDIITDLVDEDLYAIEVAIFAEQHQAYL
jgi:hypothetical protein